MSQFRYSNRQVTSINNKLQREITVDTVTACSCKHCDSMHSCERVCVFSVSVHRYTQHLACLVYSVVF